MTAIATATVSGPGAPVSSVTDNSGPALVRAYTMRVVSVDLDAALDEATSADERVPTFQLIVDWGGDNSYSQRWSNMTRMVESFTLTQELATDIPATVGYVEGTSSSKFSANLGGQFMTDGYINPDGTYIEEVDTIRAFSPYGPSGPGPVINRNMQLRTGFQTPQGPVSILQFTGHVSGYSPTASTREVVLDGLDPVSTLRRNITIYAHGVDGILLNQVGNIAYPFAINTQWFIDAILRANGYFASPPWGGNRGENGVILSATMHGSYQHEFGSVAYVTTGYYPSATGTTVIPTFAYGVSADPSDPNAHPFQMMYPTPGYDYTVKWLGRGPAPMRPDVDGWGMSGWVRLPAAGSTLTGEVWTMQPVDSTLPQLGFQMRIINGVPYAFLLYPNGGQSLYTISGYTLGPTTKWIFVGIHFKSQSNGVVITMKFDQLYGQALSGAAVPSNLVWEPSVPIYGRTLIPFTNFSVWYQPEIPGPLDFVGQTWQPNAYVDPGLNWIGGVPDIINRESYDLIKEIVAAEFGTFYFDETGKPFFRSRIINRGWNRAAELVTSQRDLSDLVMTVDDSQVRNSIDAEYGLWAVGDWEKIWEPSDPYFLQLSGNSVGNWVLPIPADTPIISETDGYVVRWISSELWSDAKDNPYYAGKVIFSVSLLSNPTIDVWQAVLANQLSGGSLVFRIRRIDATNALLTITNNLSYGVRFATASKAGTNSSTGAQDTTMTTEGEPAFRLLGRKLVEFPGLVNSTQHVQSMYQYGVLTYDLGGKSQWRQTGDSVSILSASVLSYTAKPKPVLSDVEVPHNPRRRLRDKIVLTEPDSFGARIWCTLYGRTVTYSADGARDSLTLRPDDAPPGW